MSSSRGFACVFGVTAVLCLANCSLQNFDYLKNEFPAHGGSGGTSAATSGAGGAGGTSMTEGGSTAIAGTSGSVNSGAGTSGAASGGTGGTGGDMGGGAEAGAAGAAEPPPGMLMNAGFEIGSNGVALVPDWTSVGTVAAATVVFGDHPHTGSGRLGHWLMSGAYTVSTSQVVSPIPNGNYTFSVWSGHSQFLNDEYIFAKGYSRSQPAAQMKTSTMSAGDSSYTQFSIEHIPVTNGKIEVGIYTDGPADSSENWAWIDDAALTLEPAQ